jgi:hypothetical protein
MESQNIIEQQYNILQPNIDEPQNIIEQQQQQQQQKPTRYSQNRDEILSYQKQKYRDEREARLAYQKDYNNQKRDELKDYNSKYYEQNKAKILAKSKENVVCCCGKTVSSGHMNSHLKTKLHLKKLALNK